MAEAIAALRNHTGIVIPVYVPQGVDVKVAEQLLDDTVSACCREVADPQTVCLSVDGPGSAKAMVQTVAEAHGVQTVCSEKNRGKLSAVRNGMTHLLENPDLRYLVSMDQDGDHFANELLHFVRAARHVETCLHTDRVMVLGRRISRHRPMGFLRGELEELADRIMLDALQYDAAVRGQPLRMQFANTLDEVPDFHSGYKLFTRATAAAVFTGEEHKGGVSDDGYYRHAVEAVMTVEAIKSGATLAVVNRSTLDEQPISTFGLLNRQQMISDKMIWPCKRLGVPAAFVDQWLRNHMPRLLIGTLVPEGTEELLEIRRRVMRAYGVSAGDDPLMRPLFI